MPTVRGRQRKSPRIRVANHLLDLGYKLNEADIICGHQGRSAVQNDTLERWFLSCQSPEGRKVQIYSGYTLTELQGGIEVIPNYPESCLYGDLLAVPAKKAT